MELVLTCMKCRQSSSIPPSAHHIRCHGCNTLHSVENIDDDGSVDDHDVRYKGSTQPKHRYCRSLRSKLPFGTAQTETTTTTMTVMPPRSVCMIPPARRGRRALLCGVSYKRQKHELKGTAQDVRNMNKLLLQYYNFPTESILILSEEEGYICPTKKNIEDAFMWLMRGIQPGDSLLFYFSGHGKRQREFVGDEIDGFDETICPVDFERSGMIVDNDINQAIVRPLIQGVTLHAIIDSCHSGTILDLRNVYDITARKWEDNSPPSGAYKGTRGGKAICFSACEDYQLAADTSVLSLEKEMTGAMTITFINAIKDSAARRQSISYHDIMEKMHTSIKQADKSGGFFAGIRRIFHRRILQDPQLSSSEEFDTNTEFKL